MACTAAGSSRIDAYLIRAVLLTSSPVVGGDLVPQFKFACTAVGLIPTISLFPLPPTTHKHRIGAVIRGFVSSVGN